MGTIGIKEASKKLGISLRRTQQLIKDGTLPAQKSGDDFVINEDDLGKVKIEEKVTQPKKSTPPQINELAKLKRAIDSMEKGHLREVAINQYESKLREIEETLSEGERKGLPALIEAEVKKQN